MPVIAVFSLFCPFTGIIIFRQISAISFPYMVFGNDKQNNNKDSPEMLHSTHQRKMEPLDKLRCERYLVTDHGNILLQGLTIMQT